MTLMTFHKQCFEWTSNDRRIEVKTTAQLNEKSAQRDENTARAQ